MFYQSIVTALLLSTIFLAEVSADSYKKDLLRATDVEANGQYVRKKFVSLMGKKFTKSKQKKLLVIGDSHAQDFINMAYEGGFFDGYDVKTRHIPTHCQLDLVDGYEKNIEPKYTALCEKSDNLEKALAQIAAADIIIFDANWRLWSARDLPKTIEKLQLRDDQQIIVIGRKSFGRVNVRKLLRKPKKALLSMTNPVDAVQQKINKLMKMTLDDTVYIDFQKVVCQQVDSCALFTEEAKLITFDGGHFTQSGAAFVGKKLFEKTRLKDLLLSKSD